ncbi:MAG: polynucleotide adenylyltransferase PcnB [Spirochaetales bacterium]|nr:polynucleotide adenylyltransferase PcnB [Spirochaetales bacterium]
MLVRYTKSQDGKPVKQAEVYTKEEHGLTLDQIDPDALFITRKLRAAGFEAYIVGGAVRDLLLGRKPKDFDVVTDAHPRAIKKVLPFSRLIGKRFRLVHVYFPGEKIIEVATFRSSVNGDNNTFGTLEEDAKRRDFTLNALYYCPQEQQIIDQVGGVRDIRQRKLVNVIPLDRIFDEDPVRMLRGLKYATTGKLTLSSSLSRKIREKAPLLKGMSPARLTEEFYKILFCGMAEPIFAALTKYQLLEHMSAGFGKALKSRLFNPAPRELSEGLALLDSAVLAGHSLDRSSALTYVIAPWLEQQQWSKKATTENFQELILALKEFFHPLLPSNAELENALRSLYRVWAVRPPRRKRPQRKRTFHKEPVPKEPKPM